MICVQIENQSFHYKDQNVEGSPEDVENIRSSWLTCNKDADDRMLLLMTSFP